MPGLSESLLANKSLTLAAAALALLAAAVLLAVIYRFTFGRKLRLPRNGRARLPRLGTVDAFDLDGQRQLVIVRRDNVEHLLMIGGPNDLVIESQIIRAESREPRELRDSRIRDKELREKEPREAPPLPGGAGWPAEDDLPSQAPPRRKMPSPAAVALEAETAMAQKGLAGEPIPGAVPSTVLPAPRSPAFSLPPKRAVAPAAASGQRFQSQREALQERADPSRRPEVLATPVKEFRRASVATPFLRSSTFRQAEAAGIRQAPSSAPETPNAPASSPGFDEILASSDVAAPAATGGAPAAPTTEPAALSIAAGDSLQNALAAATPHGGIDSLEAEMAKLLGRAPG